MSKVGYSLIAAISDNFVIGNQNQIPWHIPEDFRLFKNLTSGNIVVMGRKTWESLPNKPLPNRTNIVLSKSISEDSSFIKMPNLDEALEYCSDFNKEIFVIGGSSIYEQTIGDAKYLHISHIHGEFEGDSFFPKFDPKSYTIVRKVEFPEFRYICYKSKKI